MGWKERYVSSHAPVRGHLKGSDLPLEANYGFKSCPREGASCGVSHKSVLLEVSSHAPVRGHHAAKIRKMIIHAVSSHAPVRGHPIMKGAIIEIDYQFQVMPP